MGLGDTSLGEESLRGNVWRRVRGAGTSHCGEEGGGWLSVVPAVSGGVRSCGPHSRTRFLWAQHWQELRRNSEVQSNFGEHVVWRMCGQNEGTSEV